MSWRYLLNLWLSVALITGSLPAQAQSLPVSASLALAANSSERSSRDARKLDYLRGFASYLSAMVYAQGLDLRERIECLQSPSTKDSCQMFLQDRSQQPLSELEVILQAYLDMRKYLALATTQSVHGAPERGLDRHGYPLWLEREASLNHLFDRYRLHFLSNLPRVPALAPLRPAELKDLSEILSARARTSLESYYEESGLNQAPDILEADLAESRESIQRAYDQSDRSMEAFIAWDEGQRALDLQLQAGLEHYSSMYRFSNGAGLSHAVISGLSALEQENKLRYYQVLQEFPIIAFLELSPAQLDQLLTGGTDHSALYPAVARAMQTVLEVNQSYYRHLLSLQAEPLQKLIALMDLKPLAEEYFDPDLHEQELVEELVAANDWREIRQDLTTVALGVAWGFTCGAVLAWGYGRLALWGLRAAAILASQSALTIQCALTSGLGLNAIFYSHTHRRYHRTFQEFFAVSGADKENRYQVLQEISLLEEREQAMLFESLFLFVGTGVGESTRRLLSPSSQQTFVRWLQTTGAE